MKLGKYKTTQSSIFKLEHSFHILGSFDFVSPLYFNFTKFKDIVYPVTSNTLGRVAATDKAVRFLCNDIQTSMTLAFGNSVSLNIGLHFEM